MPASKDRRRTAGSPNGHMDREYVIFNYAFPTSDRRGSDWFRYGAIKNRIEAEQLAADLYDSHEFLCVEIHEMIADTLTGERHMRLVRRFSRRWSDSLRMRLSRLWMALGLAALTGGGFLISGLF